MDRVIDVLDIQTLKVIDVLILLGHRCLEPYQLRIVGINEKNIIFIFQSAKKWPLIQRWLEKEWV